MDRSHLAPASILGCKCVGGSAEWGLDSVGAHTQARMHTHEHTDTHTHVRTHREAGAHYLGLFIFRLCKSRLLTVCVSSAFRTRPCTYGTRSGDDTEGAHTIWYPLSSHESREALPRDCPHTGVWEVFAA